MATIFISELKALLNAVAEKMELYVPKKSGEYYIYVKYDSSPKNPVEFNNIRACMPVKEFLFPLRELAAVFPEPFEPEEVKPFAVFGLKDCDLRSIEILDKVFLEDEFEDPFYVARRNKMFIISSDCFEPRGSCCCTLFGGQSYAEKGFDLNLVKVKNGFIVEAGADTRPAFLQKHEDIFAEVSSEALKERDSIRERTRRQLEENNADYKLGGPVNEIMGKGVDSDVFDIESQKCV